MADRATAAALAVVATEPRRLRVGVQFSGTVTAFDDPYATVLLSDGATVFPTSLVGTALAVGDRVMVDFVPPRGLTITTPPFA